MTPGCPICSVSRDFPHDCADVKARNDRAIRRLDAQVGDRCSMCGRHADRVVTVTDPDGAVRHITAFCLECAPPWITR